MEIEQHLSANNFYGLVEDCIRVYGVPEINNSDQGVLYTTNSWEDLRHDHNIVISMDGRGRCKNNICIERFWRTIKQECIYLNPTDNVEELRMGINRFIKFYNYKAAPKYRKALSQHGIWHCCIKKDKMFDSLILLFIFALNKKKCFLSKKSEEGKDWTTGSPCS